MRNSVSQHTSVVDRRKFMFIGTVLTLSYPILSFIDFTIPKKPILIQINTPIPAGGFFVANNFILFDRGNTCWALSRKCTHLGCKLNYHEESDILECPCHQSKFSAVTGEVLKGPAKKNLLFFPVEKRESDPLYVVTT